MSQASRPRLVLLELADHYSILRFDPTAPLPKPALDPGAAFVSLTRTDTELSIICPTALARSSLVAGASDRSDEWSCFRIEGASLPDETPGIVASVVDPLADAGMSVFAIASFDTDHVLVRDADAAALVLSASGHSIVRQSTVNSDSSSTADPTAPTLRFRDAEPTDASDLAVLADAATRRLLSWLWGTRAESGQSSFEVGRSSILSDVDDLSHYTRWRVVESGGAVVGGLNSYRLRDSDVSDPAASGAILGPLNELKVAAVDTWYVAAASVFPEFQGHGIGTGLLAEAERLAVESAAGALALMVGSFNPRAKRLYEEIGFRESDRRAFGSFPGSDTSGDWILMMKEITGGSPQG